MIRAFFFVSLNPIIKSIPLFFLSLNLYAQTKNYENSSLIELKNHISESEKKGIECATFNSEQNLLLKKKYKEKIIAELSLLKPDLIILDGPLFEKINSIFHKIIEANSSLPKNFRLVLYRSNDFNAFTLGENVIFLNIGLLNQINNEDQLALVLSHEIAHNSLGHVDQAIINSVIIETDIDLKSSIKTISKAEYGHVSELNKLLVPRLLENKQESRKNEYQADSLGFIYFKNAGYNYKSAFSIFHIMENKSKKICQNIQFESFFPIEKFPDLKIKIDSYRGESSLGIIKKDTTLASYLSSHPYDRSRFLQLAILEQVDTVFDYYNFDRFDDFLSNSKEIIVNEAIKTGYINRNLTDVVYSSIRMLELNPKDSHAMQALVISLYSLSFLKEKRLSGKYLRLQNPEQPEDYDRVSAFLYALNPKECLDISNIYRHNLTNSSMIDVENIILSLLDYTIKQEFDNLGPFWEENYKEMNNSVYVWLVKDIYTYLTQTKSIRLNNN